jgi:hypothetical protein
MLKDLSRQKKGDRQEKGVGVSPECRYLGYLSGLQTAIPVVRSFVTIAFREERNPKIGQMCKERKQLALHAHFPDF